MTQGEILPDWKGGLHQIDAMRLQASRGTPLIMLDYGGFVLGDWVILSIEEKKSELRGDGSPRVIEFSMKLREYGGDAGGMRGWR